ncbi:MAG: hypothetical protein K6F98_00935 [Bacteroidales bacterium]|nr:hypothetical protein [Bacteroidales bacterium]
MKMKNSILGWIVPLFILVAIGVWQCSNEDYEQYTDEKPAWLQNLEHAQSYGATKAGSDWPLYLQSYEEVGFLKTELEISSLIDEILSDDSPILWYPSANDFSYPRINTIREVIAETAQDEYKEDANSSSLFSGHRGVLEEEVKIGMTVLLLHWLYEGKPVNSIAIADESGILYDNIGFFCMIPDNKQTEEELRIVLHPIVKSSNHESNGNLIVRTNKFDQGENILGKYAWEYLIQCSSTFNSDGILIDRSLHATYDSNWGWQCQAAVQTISGTLYEDPFHEFAWAYTHKFGGSVSISWNGVGFSISGGGTGEQGTVIHRRNAE